MFHALNRHEARAALDAEKQRTGKLTGDERAQSLRDRIGLYLRWGMRERAAECRQDLGLIPGEYAGPLPEPVLRHGGLEFGAGAASPPMDAEAVREAAARVRARTNLHAWAALHDIAAERAATNKF